MEKNKRRPKHNMGDCPISFTKMTLTKRKRGQLLQCSKCQNWFMKQDLITWIYQQGNCPICRTLLHYDVK